MSRKEWKGRKNDAKMKNKDLSWVILNTFFCWSHIHSVPLMIWIIGKKNKYLSIFAHSRRRERGARASRYDRSASNIQRSTEVPLKLNEKNSFSISAPATQRKTARESNGKGPKVILLSVTVLSKTRPIPTEEGSPKQPVSVLECWGWQFHHVSQRRQKIVLFSSFLLCTCTYKANSHRRRRGRAGGGCE